MVESSVEVRAFYWAARVSGAQAPFDTAHLKIYYPATATGSEEERMTGVLPAAAALAPLPVVVFLPGINVHPESYRWLAIAIAGHGFAVATPCWIGELLPGQLGVAAGIDIEALRPATYGERPAVPLLSATLEALAAVDGDASTPVRGVLDRSRIAVGGHSAGGSAALQATDRRFYPDVAAAFSYGAHSGLSTLLGWPAATVGKLAADCPLLLLGGTEDGVIEASAARYGTPAGAADPLARTFDEAIRGGRGDACLLTIAGANHFSIAHPIDPTSARGFLDRPARAPEAVRDLLARAIGLFLRVHVRRERALAAELDALFATPSPLVAAARRK